MPACLQLTVPFTIGMGLKAVVAILAAVGVAVLLYPRQEAFYPEHHVQGRRVLVTGASSGIGEQLAYHYARLGANVFITARREAELKRVIAACRDMGSENATFDYVVADMSNMQHPEMVVKTAVQKLGGLDHVILNHAYMAHALAWNVSADNEQNLQMALDVNVKATALVLAHTLPHLEETKGKIGIVNSIMGKICRPFFSTYCASKFALDGFIQAVRLELKPRGIDITNCIIGLIGTKSATDIATEFRQTVVDSTKRLPTIKFGDPGECALAIVKATALGQRTLYFPPGQYLWLKTVLRDLLVAWDWNDFPFKKENEQNIGR